MQKMGLDHGVGHPRLFGLASGSSWRTERSRRYLHGWQDGTHMERGVWPHHRFAAVVPSGRMCRQWCITVSQARFLG